ncbi:hypothetical protein A0H81_12760 [Grifola frondosa]|uniref:Uncharacterized protein n=1 Tax=Grifola frondosa TaxID=5627 RepID=A0A1C7LT05_GRIFR|nr:hypothetical protein A0H81_12760 [Grifola frondosa]
MPDAVVCIYMYTDDQVVRLICEQCCPSRILRVDQRKRALFVHNKASYNSAVRTAILLGLDKLSEACSRAPQPMGTTSDSFS